MKLQTFNQAISFGLSLMLTFLTVLAAPASAQNPKAWTAAASTGAVRLSDIDDVSLGTGGVAQLNTGAALNADAYIRYNVTATEGLFTIGFPRMRVRFMDSGADAQVLVRLYRVNLSTGTTSQILALDSNSYGGGAFFQTQTTAVCAGGGLSLDFTNYAYYVEAKLSRSSNNGLAKLMALQLFNESGNNCNDPN